LEKSEEVENPKCKLRPSPSPIAERHRSPSNKVLVHSRRSSEYASVNLIIRKASVLWRGGGKGGTRTVTTDSGVLKRARVSLGLPHKDNSDTDPAELLAAAHASSFSLALSNELGLRASAAGKIVTEATVTLEHLAAGWTIMNIHLNVIARLPKVTQARFIDVTVRAKTNCIVSRLLRANISMNAKLET
jgi:osmotically inducible protein OsmC